jgi:hypothetical protein
MLALQPGLASAATTLNSGVQVIASGPQPQSTDYGFKTTRHHWSVVAVDGGLNGDIGTRRDYDLTVLDRNNRTVASSRLGEGMMDFVVIDSSVVSPASYTARVVKFSGSATGPQYTVDFVDGRSTLQRGRTVLTPGSGPRRWVYIRDVKLTAGQVANFTVTDGDMPDCTGGSIGTRLLNAWLIAPTGTRAGAFQTTQQAVVTATFNSFNPCGIVFSYTAQRTGTYALVIQNFFLHQTWVDFS